jgi:hypothetical protein
MISINYQRTKTLAPHLILAPNLGPPTQLTIGGFRCAVKNPSYIRYLPISIKFSFLNPKQKYVYYLLPHIYIYANG